MSPVLDIHQSILGQPWRWRALEADARDPGFAPDDLVTQLLLARGAERETLEAHRSPSIRGFMPDPSIFRDMDKAAGRLADAVIAGEAVTVFGDYDVDGATSAALMIRLLRGLGLDPRAYIPDRLMEGYGPSGEALVRVEVRGASARKADQWELGMRVRDVAQAPDGSVFLLEDGGGSGGGRLFRLTPR